MKKTRAFLIILLLFALTLSLSACFGDQDDEPCKHIDADGDNICDKCKEEMQTEAAKVLLFEDGIPTFQFVLETGISTATKRIINEYIDSMSDIDIDISSVADKKETEAEYEILIGEITSRGDKYFYDKHELGKDGYLFKIIDKKIIVTAGSDETLTDAVEEFIEDVLMFDEDTYDYGTLYMENNQEVLEIQEYRLSSIKIGGKDMKGYTIAVDTLNKVHTEAAINMQDAFYSRTGYWFEIVALNKADPEKSIVLKQAKKVMGENGFKITAAESGQLIIECMYDNRLESAITEFLTKSTILHTESELDFKTGLVFTTDISFLTYEDFGAKGDGETDDFEALYDTHVSANQSGQRVVAKNGARYYIKDNLKLGYAASIPIKTNTDWTGATFVIDDTELDMFNSELKAMGNKNIFEVLPTYSVTTIRDTEVLNAVVAAGLNRESTKVALELGYPAMIVPVNNDHYIYRRSGYTTRTGQGMHEVIVIDEKGNIDLTSDSKTPIMFDYQKLSYIYVYRIDTEPLTVTGGTVIHLGNRTDSEYINESGKEVQAGYVQRGLNVQRSNTTINGLVHKIENEVSPKQYAEQGLQPPPYSGFFYAQNATNVTFKDCTMTARRYYAVQGTYDFGANAVNKVVLDGCVQSNFWVVYDEDRDEVLPATRDTAGVLPSMASITVSGVSMKLHWGLGGTNYCKNMEYLNSTISRFDAHAGLYNGKVINSTVNYLSLTGNGEFIVENVDWYSEGPGSNGASIFHLRSDYGSTWEGTIKAKDLRAYVDTSAASYLFLHHYQNWYYGYKAHIPSLEIDNLDLYDIKTYKALDANKKVYLMQSSVKNEPALHLDTTHSTNPRYPYLDINKDGIIDDTEFVYDSIDAESYKYVYTDNESNKNLNPIGPPDHIKIINNDGVDGTGGYIFSIPKTYNEALAIPDINGRANEGFFGSTKFYYTETDYYLGTNHRNTTTFVFE